MPEARRTAIENDRSGTVEASTIIVPVQDPVGRLGCESVLPLAELPVARFRLVVRALWLLAKFDAIAKFRGFAAIHRCIVECAVGQPPPISADAVEDEVCAAVSRACGYYPKTAACLHRSAAVVWMLLRRGVPAELVIGVRKFPFQSHAWVEVAGKVVNDKQRVRDLYLTLDRISPVHSGALRAESMRKAQEEN